MLSIYHISHEKERERVAYFYFFVMRCLGTSQKVVGWPGYKFLMERTLATTEKQARRRIQGDELDSVHVE